MSEELAAIKANPRGEIRRLKAELEALPKLIHQAKHAADAVKLGELRGREEIIPILIKRGEIVLIESEMESLRADRKYYHDLADELRPRLNEAETALKEAQEKYNGLLSDHQAALRKENIQEQQLAQKQLALSEAQEALERM